MSKISSQSPIACRCTSHGAIEIDISSTPIPTEEVYKYAGKQFDDHASEEQNERGSFPISFSCVHFFDYVFGFVEMSLEIPSIIVLVA